MESRNLKSQAIRLIRKHKFSNDLFFAIKKIKNGEPDVDLHFPQNINIETSSVCNLNCIHCPPHNKEFMQQWRKYGFLELSLFEKMMDEIDLHGKRNISLHKDGEPLIHPKINSILQRVKNCVNHSVYLTTNGYNLSPDISTSILENKIDSLNISLGAINQNVYEKIRGGNIRKVMGNVHNFLELRKKSSYKPRVIVQIIDLDNFDLQGEIKQFVEYWGRHDVEIQIWDELTWGISKTKHQIKYRYPCFSLWNSLSVNSDGLTSACCMDWNQSLLTGDLNAETIKAIWSGEKYLEMRIAQKNLDFNKMELCKMCNYWHWQPMLKEYAT